MEERKYYILQRWISRNTGWVDEGPEYKTEKEAMEELLWYQKNIPQERWRLRTRRAMFLYGKQKIPEIK